MARALPVPPTSSPARGAHWSRQAELSDPDAVWLGSSVALSGDTALVGAPLKTVGGHIEAGAVYVDVLASLVTPKLTFKLNGLTGGALRLGKRVTAKGTVTPQASPAARSRSPCSRRRGQVAQGQEPLRTIAATGTYSWKYKPAKKGTYRMQATIAETATHAAAKTAWRTFKVK